MAGKRGWAEGPGMAPESMSVFGITRACKPGRCCAASRLQAAEPSAPRPPSISSSRRSTLTFRWWPAREGGAPAFKGQAGRRAREGATAHRQSQCQVGPASSPEHAQPVLKARTTHGGQAGRAPQGETSRPSPGGCCARAALRQPVSARAPCLVKYPSRMETRLSMREASVLPRVAGIMVKVLDTPSWGRGGGSRGRGKRG